MTDGIIKGSGNSRYLKTVPNAAALYPTYDSYRDALAAGTFPIDLNGINPAGWETVGMKLDKANLLTDALCTALGLATTATPTEAMEKLRTLVNTAQSTADSNNSKLSCGSYSGTGGYLTLSFPFNPKFIILCEHFLYIDTSNPTKMTIGLFFSQTNKAPTWSMQQYYSGLTGIGFVDFNISGSTLSLSAFNSSSYANITYEHYYVAIG